MYSTEYLDMVCELLREFEEVGEFPNLCESDKSLLEDYAPKLFSTFESSNILNSYEELRNVIRGLCEILDMYRFESLFKSGITTHTDSKLFKNQGEKQRLIKLQNRAKDMLNIIDDEEHELFENERTNELRAMLLDVVSAPNLFYPVFAGRVTNMAIIKKDRIKEYLKRFSTEKLIREFLSSIKPSCEEKK